MVDMSTEKRNDEIRSYTITEACRRIGVSRQTVMNWIQSDKIEARKSTGEKGAWLIPYELVEAKRIERREHLERELAKIPQ